MRKKELERGNWGKKEGKGLCQLFMFCLRCQKEKNLIYEYSQGIILDSCGSVVMIGNRNIKRSHWEPLKTQLQTSCGLGLDRPLCAEIIWCCKGTGGGEYSTWIWCIPCVDYKPVMWHYASRTMNSAQREQRAEIPGSGSFSSLFIKGSSP